MTNEKFQFSPMIMGQSGYVSILWFLRLYYEYNGYNLYLRLEVYFFGWQQLPGIVLNPSRMQVDLPPFEIKGIFGETLVKLQGSAALNMSRCTVDFSLYVYVKGIYEGRLEVSIPYGIPFPIQPPQWNSAKVDPEKLKKALQEGQLVKGALGAHDVLYNPMVQDVMKGLLFLTGGSGVIENHINSARRMTEMESGFPDVLLGIGFQVSGGLGGGLGAGAGLFFSSKGEFGVYGGYELDFGFLAHISASVVGTVMWGLDGKSALENFQGTSNLITFQLNADEIPIGGGLALYMPQGKSAPSGFSINLGLGIGSPIEFYLGQSTTFAHAFTGYPELEKNAVQYVDLVLGNKQLTA